MRVVPERSPWLQLTAAFGGFLTGPLVALRLASSLTPDSEVVQTASVLAFAAIFAGGAVIWLGVGVAALALRLFSSLIRGRSPRLGSRAAGDRLVPPGYQVFIPLGIASGLAVGLLAGLTTPLSIALATATWSALGLAYGLLLWAAARHGYLPFEPE